MAVGSMPEYVVLTYILEERMMGYIRHHAIVVTDWRKEVVGEAQELAVELGMNVSSVHQAPINDSYSFCVFPDGSKEGWEESDEGDRQREELIVALEWNTVPYVCIEYGGDDRDKVTVEHLGDRIDESGYSTEWKGTKEERTAHD